tara:strand:- start:783 stop:1232 length:450 start_codon:yes stop_codon:yes gene_type:complete
MKFLNLVLALSCFAISFTAHNAQARKAVLVSDANAQTCKMVETATLGINFSNIPVDLKSSKSFIQQKADEILAIAADLGIDDIQVQNMNYSIYSNNNGGCNASTASVYQLSGNVSFQIPNAGKAESLMQALGEKSYNVNFNMNAYRQCQ